MLTKADYIDIGKRIKTARNEKHLSQADLAELVNCSNNHISHIEVAQTKVSLSKLLEISQALDKDIYYFLLETQYADSSSIIDHELLYKLKLCNAESLRTIDGVIDVLLARQNQKPVNQDK